MTCDDGIFWCCCFCWMKMVLKVDDDVVFVVWMGERETGWGKSGIKY